jgi:DNA-directed RNA polymerase subunit RPC12/RpoP
MPNKIFTNEFKEEVMADLLRPGKRFVDQFIEWYSDHTSFILVHVIFALCFLILFVITSQFAALGMQKFTENWVAANPNTGVEESAVYWLHLFAERLWGFVLFWYVVIFVFGLWLVTTIKSANEDMMERKEAKKIKKTIGVKCPKCSGRRIYAKGKTAKGTQKYICVECGTRFTGITREENL